MNILGIIPARGGSKSIPKKNIKLLAGKPLIYWTIKAAKNSKLQVGDRFVTGCFIKEQPLYLPYIERNGERTASFVAGRNGGLTLINTISL